MLELVLHKQTLALHESNKQLLNMFSLMKSEKQGFILQGKSNAAGVSNMRPGVQHCPDKDYNLAKIWRRAYIFRLLTVFFFN